VINEIGLFIQHSVPLREPALPMPGRALPWPYRSVAEWWPEVLPLEAEARLLANFVRRCGEPGLEVGSGSGRRLSYCRAQRIDIDGLEPARGLYAACRAQLEREGLSGHRLYSQPLHEIDLPRRYRSIHAARVLGTGASADADAVGLFRLYRALEPGGVLLLDHPAPWGDRWGWLGRLTRASWSRRWPPPLAPCELQGPSGHDVLHLSSAVYDHAADTAALTYTVQARYYQHGELVSKRGFALRQRFYTRCEVHDLLRRAGFEPSHVACVHLPESERHVWIAEKVQRWRATPPSPLGPLRLAGSIGARWHGIPS